MAEQLLASRLAVMHISQRSTLVVGAETHTDFLHCARGPREAEWAVHVQNALQAWAGTGFKKRPDWE